MTRRTSNRRLLVALAVALALAGCHRHTLYHHFEHPPLSGWDRADTLIFPVASARQEAVMQREVELRISEKYPFQHLTLIVEQTTLPAGILRRDTVNCNLVDQDGNVLGKGITLFQYRFALPATATREGDSLTIAVRHNMKREMLPGITDVGLRLTAQ